MERYKKLFFILLIVTTLLRLSLIGKIGRVVSQEKGKEVTHQGPIIHERFVVWNDINRPAPRDWEDYWRVTIALSPAAIRTSGRAGRSISVGEARVQIVEG